MSLATGLGSGGDAQGDTLANIESLTGSAFNDTLEGNSGINVLAGGAGTDMLQGLGGADTLDGGAGADTASYAASAAGVNVSLATGLGSDGDAQGDTLANIENLTGSALGDVLTGSSGANVLSGGGGADNLTGGGGSDKFLFTDATDSTPSARDVITDFMQGVDIIDLSGVDANTSKAKDQAFAFGGQNSNVVANSVTWFESGGNTIVQADVNGNTTADLTIVLTGINHNLSASDFIL